MKKILIFVFMCVAGFFIFTSSSIGYYSPSGITDSGYYNLSGTDIYASIWGTSPYEYGFPYNIGSTYYPYSYQQQPYNTYRYQQPYYPYGYGMYSGSGYGYPNSGFNGYNGYWNQLSYNWNQPYNYSWSQPFSYSWNQPIYNPYGYQQPYLSGYNPFRGYTPFGTTPSSPWNSELDGYYRSIGIISY